MTVSFILIPCDITKPLQSLELDLDDEQEQTGGDQLPNYLKTLHQAEDNDDSQLVEVTPLKRLSSSSSSSNSYYNSYNSYSNTSNTSNNNDNDGVYAYYFQSTDMKANNNQTIANIRATTLSMACGLLSRRFYGDVYISRLGYSSNNSMNNRQLMNLSIGLDEINLICLTGPDIRQCIIEKVCPTPLPKGFVIPTWLQNAARDNYEDSSSLSSLANVMRQQKQHHDDEEEDSDDDDNEGEEEEEEELTENDNDDTTDKKNTVDMPSSPSAVNEITTTTTMTAAANPTKEAITRTPLCIHCRRPAKTLCPISKAAYFCDAPRTCMTDAWSHKCICNTWALYISRRKKLSKFPFLWHKPLIGRECQISEEPYKNYLKNVLCVLYDEHGIITRNDLWWDSNAGSWWETEVDGWGGGQSKSAILVDPSIRRSYQEGFKLDEHDIPEESPISSTDAALCMIQRDECGLLELTSWKDYYALRRIPLTSPVALLCTFPLTIYHAIQKFGSVPITVSRMLKRPMRLHVLGVEKEMNFLDLFKEIGFLLPDDVKVEMVFIIREDMLPPNCEVEDSRKGYTMDLELTPNLKLIVQSGSYADTIDPSFDCGSGPPDMVMGLNAGLFAYESWRSVVEYLNASANSGVVSVFSDYNEHSGVNCASLGGGKARESLCINPFRQPRAMPVYSMNLPQFSNGFMYVYNEQELDM